MEVLYRMRVWSRTRLPPRRGDSFRAEQSNELITRSAVTTMSDTSLAALPANSMYPVDLAANAEGFLLHARNAMGCRNRLTLTSED
jgi:hypothetical protein